METAELNQRGRRPLDLRGAFDFFNGHPPPLSSKSTEIHRRVPPHWGRAPRSDFGPDFGFLIGACR